MSTLKTTSITHESNSGTANLALASTGNVTVGADLIATKQNGCQRIVLEQFYCPCDGTVIALQDGNHTITDKDDVQVLTTTYADVVGSSIAYTPPSGTTHVIYEYTFNGGRQDSTPVGHFRFYIDSDEVTDARYTIAGDHLENQWHFKWGIHIGGSAVTATGRQASWSSAKTLKLQARDYTASNDMKLNMCYNWDGTADEQFHSPALSITAIG